MVAVCVGGVSVSSRALTALANRSVPQVSRSPDARAGPVSVLRLIFREVRHVHGECCHTGRGRAAPVLAGARPGCGLEAGTHRCPVQRLLVRDLN